MWTSVRERCSIWAVSSGSLAFRRPGRARHDAAPSTPVTDEIDGARPDLLSDTMPEGTGRLSGIRERQPVSENSRPGHLATRPAQRVPSSGARGEGVTHEKGWRRCRVVSSASHWTISTIFHVDVADAF